MVSFKDVLDAIENRADMLRGGEQRSRGAAFEQATKYFLTHDPAWASVLSDVWLWSEPNNPLNPDGSAKDDGIDLVGRGRDDELWAIQCKYYQPNEELGKRELDTFFADAASRGVGNGHLIVAATTPRFTSDVKREIKRNGCVLLGLNDFESEGTDWSEFLPGAPKETRLRPRDDQQQAIDACVEGFKEHDRGKLVMACGTGKTLTSLRLAEELMSRRDQEEPSKAGSPFRVLFLAPSIALVSQTLRSWMRQAKEPIQGHAVCSDPSAANGGDTDETVLDMHFPSTTDPQRLAEAVETSETLLAGGGLDVVFSTYQSIQTTIDAQKQNGMPGFDLAVCDEAHRTAGTADGPESPFVKIHDRNLVNAERRLYMTATPKIYSQTAKGKAADRAAVLYSMDDENTFGPEFYRLDFGKAVELGILTDYKVLVLGVSEQDPDALADAMGRVWTDSKGKTLKELAARVGKARNDASRARRQADLEKAEKEAAGMAGKLVGVWDALRTRGVHEPIDTGLGGKVILGLAGQEHGRPESGGGKDVEPMRTAVAFTRSIADSKAVAQGFFETVARWKNELAASGRPVAGDLRIAAQHVDGSMSAGTRQEKLDWIAAGKDPDECRVLTNARCLTEGIDLPSLDAVVFLQPRNSQIDIVQAVGRVMRKAPGKKYGYVIVPVVVPEDADPAAALASSDFDTVWQILQSLRSIDGHFDAMVNALALRNRERKAQDRRKGGKKNRNGIKASERRDAESMALRAQDAYQGDLDLDERVSTLFQARLVAKCGTTGYWDDWAGTVARIYEKTRQAVEQAVGREGKARDLFNGFLESLRGTLDPKMSEKEAVGMVSSHLVTGPVFDALFGQRTDAQGRRFADLNPVSRAMKPIATALRPLVEETDSENQLEHLYSQVRVAASAVRGDPAARQALVRDLYEKFFKTAFEADAKKLGVVYTPTGIVDWIEHAADRLLKQHFGLRLRDEGVNILDPFTGTGTFIARLLSNGLIPAQDLERKYERELWANEIMPLAYYIAMVNIESEYAAARHAAGLESGYEPFPGGCLTDTFRSTEDSRTLDSRLFGENNERVEQENRTPITVIVANPPYSAHQKDANDGNANEHYPALDQRIAETYIAGTKAQNKNGVYDSYIRAFRWASDRIAGPDGTGRGVIGFVSGGGWLKNLSFNGFRRSLCDEFSDIWVLDLRGNGDRFDQTKEQLRREGENVFRNQSQSPIAVTLLVRDPGSGHHGRIHYHDIGETLSADEKLGILARTVEDPIGGTEWESLEADKHGDWLDQRDDSFDELMPLALGKADEKRSALGVFAMYSCGIKTGRDAYSYSYSHPALAANMERLCDSYRLSVESGERIEDMTRINWTRSLIHEWEKHKQIAFDPQAITEALYRPFCKKWLYYDPALVEMMYRNARLFPKELVSEANSDSREDVPQREMMYRNARTSASPLVNMVIDAGGVGSAEYSVFASMTPVDLDAIKHGQCLPLYWYEKIQAGDGLFDEPASRPGDLIVTAANGARFVRHDAITDKTLSVFRETYPREESLQDDPSKAKTAVFAYIYGILNTTEYRRRYAANLTKEPPRIPLAKNFKAFRKAGTRLLELHAGYESAAPWTAEHGVADGIREAWKTADHDGFRILDKLRFAKNGKDEDRTRIIVNQALTLENIPSEAYEWTIKGLSPIEWILNQYQVKTDKKSGNPSDPNQWGIEHGNPRYIIDLVEKAVTVSMKTQEIRAGLPPIDPLPQTANWPTEWATAES